MLIGEGKLRYAPGGENLQVVRIILTFPAGALFLAARIQRKQMTNGFNFEMVTVNFFRWKSVAATWDSPVF
jgi:hypothetical protein